MRINPVFRSAALALFGLTALTGCKAQEAQPTAFLSDPALMAKNEELPFQRTYWNNAFDSKFYNELLVAPVNTDYVMAQTFWEKSNTANLSKEKISADVKAMAEYTRNSFMKAAQDDPNKRFKVVDTAGPKTLILEVAVVQLVPSKPALAALGFVTWIPHAVKVAGKTGSESEDTGKGAIAIEGRVRDGKTGEIIGMFADREHPKVALVDLQAFTWWEPCKGIIDDWSRHLVEVANRPPGGVVNDSPAFELMVW